MGPPPGQRTSRDEQRAKILQLLRDRKNGVGGYATSFKDFEELGPWQGEHWPFSPESLRRAFGIPVDKEDPLDSDYVLERRAYAHRLLEDALEGKGDKPSELKRHCYSIYQAVNAVFPRDSGEAWTPGNLSAGGGDKDYEWIWQLPDDLQEKARLFREEAKKLERKAKAPHPSEAHKRLNREAMYKDRIRELHYRADDLSDRVEEVKGILVRLEIGIDYLTDQLKNEDLFVQFVKAMTVRDEKKMEARNAEIATFYEAERAQGKSEKSAALHTRAAFGIHESTVRRIIEFKRLDRGEPKRPRGRPRKS